VLEIRRRKITPWLFVFCLSSGFIFASDMMLHVNNIDCLQFLKADRCDFTLRATNMILGALKFSLDYKSTSLIKIVFHVSRLLVSLYFCNIHT
jgi:hypothetical protein